MQRPPARAAFIRYPMFWLALCFAGGILSAGSIDAGAAAYCVGFVTVSVLACLFRRREVGTLLFGTAVLFAGAFTSQWQMSVSSDRIKVLYDSAVLVSGTPVDLEGILVGRPEPSFDGEFLSIKADAILYHGAERRVSGNVRVFVPTSGKADTDPVNFRSDISNLKYGSRVRIAGAIKREDEYLNPGVHPRREILDRQNIDATCSLKSSLLIEHLADESVFLPLAWVYDQRANLINDFRDNLSQYAAGIMIASLLGDKYFLDKDTADLFREGGTFHILVISGLHITFIGGLLLLFVRWLTRNRWIHFVTTSTVLWAYTLAVGADVPVVRAAVMFTIVLLGYAIYRRGSLLNSLGICAVVLLAWRPHDIFNPSFQLTFVSVGSIVLLAYPLIEHLRKIGTWTPTPAEPFPPKVPRWLRVFCERMYWREAVWSIESKRNIWTAGLRKSPSLASRVGDVGQRIVRYLFEGILVSLIVQFAMLPLAVIYFHRVAVSGILLNLWVGFFIAVESFAAVIGAVTSHVSTLLAAPFFVVADAADWAMLLLPRLFSGEPWASFRIPAYAGEGRAVYVIFFIAMAVLAYILAYWKPFALRTTPKFLAKRTAAAIAALAVAAASVIIIHPFSSPTADGRLHIDFLDVGQGDCALITFTDGTTWLVDGGGRMNYRQSDEGVEAFMPDSRGIGESVVSEVLWAKGYSYIDRIVATHADADHIQGLVDVAKNFSVGTASLGRMPGDDPELKELTDVLTRRRVPIELVARGGRVDIGGARVEILYPLSSSDPGAVSDNNHSVVIRIVFGTRAFLLTGDIEREAETDMLKGGGTLAADVVKLAHHGSRTSSTPEFISASHPQYAVISVGRRSPFGHPHREIVERWQAAGVQVITTGENGMISVSTDGKDLQLSRFAP